MVSGAQPHWHCFCSSPIHLCQIWGKWVCRELHSVPTRMRLLAFIFDLLLNFFMRESTSSLKQHICITISTTNNLFSQEVWKKENEWRRSFLQYWVTQEPHRTSFSPDFWNWKENNLRKRHGHCEPMRSIIIKQHVTDYPPSTPKSVANENFRPEFQETFHCG